MDVKIPNMPDVAGDFTKDEQLRNLLVATKQTLEILTGSDTHSNTALIDLLNDNQ